MDPRPARGVRSARGARRLLLAALALALGACDAAEYTVVVRFPSSALRARAAGVELFVAPACDPAAVARGAAPARASVTRSLAVAPSGTTAAGMSLGGALAPGRYGVWARARGVDCAVIAAGCAEHALVAGGRGPLVVSLAALDPSVMAPAGCEGSGVACSNGVCAAPQIDGGVGGDVVNPPPVDVPDATSACPAGQVACGGRCVDAQSDATNCGACGRACAPREVCSAGACSDTCAPPRTLCLGAERMVCADLASDATNCGECGRPCVAPPGGTSACVAGRCTTGCAPGTHLCGAACVPDTSATACGAACAVCTAPANATAVCAAGACDFACNPGYARSGAACVASCGNRALDAGETCDDGNTTAGDGCSASCQLEPPASGSMCAPRTIIVRTGTQQYLDTTVGGTSLSRSTDCGGGTGPERYYELRLATLGFYSITVTPLPEGTGPYQPVVYELRSSGACPGEEGTSCERAARAGAAVRLSGSFSPLPGAAATFVIDSLSSATAGPFRLQISSM